MKLLIDDADLQAIRRVCDLYPCDGVTTNPSILAKTGRPPREVLEEIRAFLGPEADLHVQVLSRDAEGMVREGRRIAQVLGKNTYIKVPAVPQGLKAMRALSGQGFRVTATAVYTPQQAFLAGKAGADFAAPYVNRIDNLGGDGVETACRIQELYRKNGMKTQVLAASFKNTRQVLALAEYGAAAATASPDVIEGLLRDPAVSAAVDAFASDFEGLCGPGATMLEALGESREDV